MAASLSINNKESQFKEAFTQLLKKNYILTDGFLLVLLEVESSVDPASSSFSGSLPSYSGEEVQCSLIIKFMLSFAGKQKV